MNLPTRHDAIAKGGVKRKSSGRRQRYDRVVRALLECGHERDINTSRQRVTADLAAIIFGHAQRKGVWCDGCGATCQPVKMLGVFRA